MKIWTKKTPHAALVPALFLWAGSLAAQDPSGSPGMDSMAPSGSTSEYIEPMGMGLAPPVYLVNFMFMYIANPELAAYMPAYRAGLPQEVYECLHSNPYYPENCSYAQMQQYFEAQAAETGGSGNKKSLWPDACQTEAKWQRLAPRKYRHSDQINEPLGKKKAAQIAQRLGIDDDMILTDGQYQCMIGTPPVSVSQKIISSCTQYLSNSNGNADTPLSSYGLYVGPDENVRSLCAPAAACLEFNKLFVPDFVPGSKIESLWQISRDCGFFGKLARLMTETPLIEFGWQGYQCQDQGPWQPSCIVETACPGNGGQSNSNCMESLVND